MTDAFETFFAPIATAIESFAAAHHMRVSKYRHNVCDWTLEFRHPGGDLGAIQVLRYEDCDVMVAGRWCFYDFIGHRLFIAEASRVIAPRIESSLTTALEDMLKQVIGFTRSDAKPSTQTYHDLWTDDVKAYIRSEMVNLPELH